MIIVFINSKLLSVDTILPFCISYKNRYPDQKFRFFCVGSKKTVLAIRESSILNRALNYTGKLSDVGGTGIGYIDELADKYKIFRKLIVSFNLVWTLFHVFCFGGKVIHFKFWEHTILRLFPRIKPKRFIQFHPNCWGDTETVDAANLADGRKKVHSPLVCLGSVVTFHDYWSKYLGAKALNLPAILAAPTRASDDWLKFVNEGCADLIDIEKKKIGYCADNRPVTIILNTLDQATKCKSLDTPRKCLKHTLDTLWRLCPERPVILKPHVITNMSALEKLLEDTLHENFHLTNIHLAALGRLSSLAICNLFSLGIADCWLSGCPTLEYTEYNEDVLRATQGSSFGKEFIDVFLSGYSADLEETIKSLLVTQPVERQLENHGFADAQRLVEFVANPC